MKGQIYQAMMNAARALKGIPRNENPFLEANVLSSKTKESRKIGLGRYVALVDAAAERYLDSDSQDYDSLRKIYVHLERYGKSESILDPSLELAALRGIVRIGIFLEKHALLWNTQEGVGTLVNPERECSETLADFVKQYGVRAQ